jgi:hypothetical protein
LSEEGALERYAGPAVIRGGPNSKGTSIIQSDVERDPRSQLARLLDTEAGLDPSVSSDGDPEDAKPETRGPDSGESVEERAHALVREHIESKGGRATQTQLSRSLTAAGFRDCFAWLSAHYEFTRNVTKGNRRQPELSLGEVLAICSRDAHFSALLTSELAEGRTST